MVLIPKKNKKTVYQYLFKEGVLCAKKDVFAPKHQEIDVPNLHVLMLLKSLASRGYVTEKFSWLWNYWFLTNEGIEYLREYLHLPTEIVPATLKKQASRPARPTGAGYGRDREGRDRDGGERRDDGYRRAKPTGPDAGFKAEFRGGFGRGGRGAEGGAPAGERPFRSGPRPEGGRGFGGGRGRPQSSA
eukprot:GILJ01000078.1.p1 GENE.GILJ01000078.1~~GILJ01000078.1.p1  ORF type:complete len:210 (-),score=27.83 GILJ01000078.1:364-927(-)